MRLKGIVVCGLAGLALAPLTALSAQTARPVPGSAIAGPLRPAQVVARLASRALAGARDSATWGALSASLSDLAVKGHADIAATFAAAHIADSLAQAEPRAATTPPERASSVAGLVAVARRGGVVVWRSMEKSDVALPALTVLLAVLFLLRLGERRRSTTAHHDADEHGRVWTARALATGGVDLAEISRRTGLAQEAVDMALHLAGPVRRTRRSAR